MQFLLQQSALLKIRGAFPKGDPSQGYGRTLRPKPFPNHPCSPPHPRCSFIPASHSAPQLTAQMQRWRRCHIQGTETILYQSGEGRRPGDTFQQLGRGFIASCHEEFFTTGKTNKYFGHHSTLVALRVNLSISL